VSAFVRIVRRFPTNDDAHLTLASIVGFASRGAFCANGATPANSNLATPVGSLPRHAGAFCNCLGLHPWLNYISVIRPSTRPTGNYGDSRGNSGGVVVARGRQRPGRMEVCGGR
jgi:hypothetical protein